MKSSKADARRWLGQAENDLAAAQVMVREGFFAQACFMSHQVAEKALKALAYYRGDRYVMGHSLTELVAQLESTHPELLAHKEAAGVLDQHYVPTRYPNALPGSAPFEVYTQRQAKEAVSRAGEIVALAGPIVSA